MIGDGYIEIIKIVPTNEEGQSVIEKIHSYLPDLGGYNTLPEPRMEITEDDYLYFSMAYTPIAIEHRQVHPDYTPSFKEKVFHDTWVYYYHDYAIAIVYPNRWKVDYKNTKNGIKYIERPKYYLLGEKVIELQKHRERNGYE